MIKYRQVIDNCFHYWGYIDECFIGPITNQIPKPVNCQFTGLHDVNSVEIYEGDIVSVPGVGNVEVKICPHYGVVYCFPVSKGNYEIPYADCAAENDFPTIIGNIYQNSELLK
jgi:uncharacterized phage protein (TIGR01671 family)